MLLCVGVAGRFVTGKPKAPLLVLKHMLQSLYIVVNTSIDLLFLMALGVIVERLRVDFRDFILVEMVSAGFGAFLLIEIIIMRCLMALSTGQSGFGREESILSGVTSVIILLVSQNSGYSLA